MKIQIDDDVRNATPDELARIEQVQNDAASAEMVRQNATAAKISAHSKLKTLGLTDDEIKAVLG
jgi:hypothetical protein